VQESGAPLRKVSKLLGHSNTQITEQQYTHFKETEYFDAINLLKINVKLKKD
jgi:site-specific recombinase XerD